MEIQVFSSKSQVMKFTKHTMHINLRLDNNIISECKTLKHEGIILEKGFNSTERNIAACRLIRPSLNREVSQFTRRL